MAIDDAVSYWLNVINKAIVGTPLCFLGVAANAVNIRVILDRSFRDSTDISLLGLAVADIGCLASLQWSNFMSSTILPVSQYPWLPTEPLYFIGTFLHADFTRTVGWITSFIALERCLCVVKPFRVKSVFRPRTTLGVILTLFVVTLLIHVPDYASLSVGLTRNSQNQSVLVLIAKENRAHIGNLSFILSNVSTTSTFVIVIILAVVLILQLLRASKNRALLISATLTDITRSQQVRQDRTIKIVLLMTGFYIAATLPSMVIYSCSVADPQLSFLGTYKSDFITLWSLAFLSEAFNSSVRVFLYYRMSSRYRRVFQRIFSLSTGKRMSF